MKVWIDEDLCTGDGLCIQDVPRVFDWGDDDLAYVKGDAGILGPRDLATVPAEFEDRVVDAAIRCPGQCIFIEEHDEIPYTPESEGTRPRLR